MSHASARTTFHGRKIVVQRHQKGWPQAHIARAMGVSRACVARWIARFEEAGEAGLHDRSSRPHSSPTRTSAKVEASVLRIRRERRVGQDRIAEQVGAPARTASRILRRHHEPYLRHLDPITGQVIRSSKATAVRYERDRPGQLVHMDVKKIGRIPDGGGWKAHGRGSRKITRRKGHKVGYDYVHSVVDDHTRLAYCEALPDEKGSTCARFLLRAAAWFAERGVTVQEVMTDNHWSYTKSTDFAAAIDTIGARHLLIKPHCPWQNGKVERFNRTLATEWAYARPCNTNASEHLRPGSTTTTITAATPHSQASRPSAGYPGDGRVRLG